MVQKAWRDLTLLSSITSLTSIPTEFSPYSQLQPHWLSGMPNIPTSGLDTWLFPLSGMVFFQIFTWLTFSPPSGFAQVSFSGEKGLGTICIWVTAEAMVLIRSPKECVYNGKRRWSRTKPRVTPRWRESQQKNKKRNQQRVRKKKTQQNQKILVLQNSRKGRDRGNRKHINKFHRKLK